MMALAGLCQNEAAASRAPEGEKPGDPLGAKAAQFTPRAKRVIFLFMHGGPSQVDTFDPKPALARDNGKPYPGQKPRVQFAETGNLLKSPWEFRRYGQSGIEVRDLVPHVGGCAAGLSLLQAIRANHPADGV